MHVWTTHDEYLVVFITVQNLVVIDAVVLIINMFGMKMPIHAKMGFLGGFYPLNGEQSHHDPKRHFLVQKHIIRHIDH